MEWVVAVSVSAGFGALMGWVYSGFPGLPGEATRAQARRAGLSAARDSAIRSSADRNGQQWSYVMVPEGGRAAPAYSTAYSFDGMAPRPTRASVLAAVTPRRLVQKEIYTGALIRESAGSGSGSNTGESRRTGDLSTRLAPGHLSAIAGLTWLTAVLGLLVTGLAAGLILLGLFR